MGRHGKCRMSARKASWLAFGLVALAAASNAVDNHEGAKVSLEQISEGAEPASVASQPQEPVRVHKDESSASIQVELTTEEKQQADQAAEATRAYKQALATLSTLTAQAPSHTYGPSWAYGSSPSVGLSTNSFLAPFIPDLQGQGPIGTTLRVVIKLHHSFRDALLSIGFDKPASHKGKGAKVAEEELDRKAIKVIDLLQHAADLGHDKALYTLAKLSLFPPTSHFPSSPETAFSSLQTHVERTGNATSHSLLAFFYASGYRPLVEGNSVQVVQPDPALAQLHYTFAAHGGDKGAQMALGYRYWTGIGALEDCGRALEWYEAASERAMAKFLAGPPGGRTLPQTPTRLSDLVGGIYGPGASAASSGINNNRAAIKAGAARAAGETWEDVLDYYTFNADREEVDFAYRLGKIFYQGSIYASPGGIASGSEGVSAIPRDLPRARHYFLGIARKMWSTDPVNPLSYKPTFVKDEESAPYRGYAAASAAFLGRMALRGEGVKKDAAVAKMWFERGAEYGDRESHNGLGIIYRDGLLDGKSDMKKALAYFKVAAKQELAEAEVNIGKYHYERGELGFATGYFELAIKHGSPFEAHYYLGSLHAAQALSSQIPEPMAASACAMAVSYHKIVSERGVWDDDLLRDAEIAWLSGTNRGKETAILKWWIAAERGHEIAQNNLAYVLDQDKSVLRLTRFSPMTPSNETAHLALTQWTRAAAQRNVDALVKVADYYYHGLGVKEEPEATRLEKAARYYQSAADTHFSGLALWNLGWMYENGVGVDQDFHLAKRHYDLALDTSTEAYIPVMLSLGKLYAKSIWHTLRGGTGGLNIWPVEEDEDVTEFDGDVNEESRGLEGAHGADKESDVPVEEDNTIIGEDADSVEEDDSPWYFGKAKDEFNRRKQGRAHDDDDDPIKWARDRRNAESERENDYGPEDDFDGTLRGSRREDEGEDEFNETALLVMLCLAVSVLLYVRTRLVHRVRGRQDQDENARQPANENGVFPPAGDPARNDWAIIR